MSGVTATGHGDHVVISYVLRGLHITQNVPVADAPAVLKAITEELDACGELPPWQLGNPAPITLGGCEACE